MALLVTTCLDGTPQLSHSKFSSRTLTIDFISFFNSVARFPSRPRKTYVFAKNTYLCESRIPHPLPPSCLLAGFNSDISQRPPSFILRKSCSPACAEHGPWMNGVPPRSSRCAKHTVRNTWLRCLRKTWYSVTSTGRRCPHR